MAGEIPPLSGLAAARVASRYRPRARRPTDDGVFLTADADSQELLEPIRGTTASISCLVFPRQGRIVVIDIRS